MQIGITRTGITQVGITQADITQTSSRSHVQLTIHTPWNDYNSYLI